VHIFVKRSVPWLRAFALALVASFVLAPSIAAWAAACGKANFSPKTYTVAEDDGQVLLTIVLVMDLPEDRTRSVSYQAQTGTAKSGSDFAPESGTLNFAPGGGSKTFDIGIVDNSTSEPIERFEVQLKPGPGSACVSLGPDATVTVVDDDPVPKPSPPRESDSPSAQPPSSSGGSSGSAGLNPATGGTSLADSLTPSPSPSQTSSAQAPPGAEAGDVAAPFSAGVGGRSTLAVAGIVLVALALGSAAAVFVRRRFLVTPPPS
jgi:Calx-beta domain-containing protein